MAPSVTLHYFTLRGRGELPRIILSAAGIKYDEVIFKEEEWTPELKAKFPFGQAPALYWDGEEVTQSMSINRYIAKKTGLAGSNDEEFIRADIIAENVNDLLIPYWFSRYDTCTKRQDEFRKSFVEQSLPNFFKYHEKYLEKKGGKFVNGKALSYGDLALFFLIDLLRNETEMKSFNLDNAAILKTVDSSPLCSAVYETIKASDNVAAYLKDRKSATYVC